MRKALKNGQYIFEPFTLGCIIIIIIIIVLSMIASAQKKEQGAIAPTDISSTDVLLTDISKKPAGTEVRSIDNSKGDGKILSTVEVINEWTQEHSIEYEHAISAKIDVKQSLLVISHAAEAALETKFSTTSKEGQKQTYRYALTIEVPPRSKSEILFQWTQVWQNGNIRINTSDGREVRVPFSVFQGLSCNPKAL